MKIRFHTSIVGERFAFQAGRVYDVPHPTPEMLAWLRPRADGSVRASVVREDESEMAVSAPVRAETAVTRKRGRRG